jgi:serine/threonine protein kinase
MNSDNVTFFKNKEYPFSEVYMIGKKIGSGSFGAVYEGVNKITKGKVAIKMQKPGSSHDKMFKKEIEVLIKVSDQCKRYVCIDGFGVRDGKYFIVMEYIQGTELRAFKQKIDTEQFLCIGNQLFDALDELHERGIAHMDLKPANIMIDKDFNVRLIDMGLSCFSKACSSGGSPYYMPGADEPEFSLKERKGMDFYSLAVSMSEVVKHLKVNSKRAKKVRLYDNGNGNPRAKMILPVRIVKFFIKVVSKSENYMKIEVKNT